MYLKDTHKVWLATGSSPIYLDPSMANRPGLIAGIAMGRREAIDLLRFMTEDAVQSGRNPADPRELIL